MLKKKEKTGRNLFKQKPIEWKSKAFICANTFTLNTASIFVQTKIRYAIELYVSGKQQAGETDDERETREREKKLTIRSNITIIQMSK